MHDQVVFPRRDFLKLVGLGVAGAAAGCAGAPPERLIPYLVQPSDVLPGIPYWYATTCQECPAGCGILVKQREGRAIKIEGNPAHPVNRGGLCARGHAALQGLYDPDRVRGPMRREGTSWKAISWEEALRLAVGELNAARGRLALVTGNTTGSFQRLCGEWVTAAGGTHLVYEPFAYESMREANRRTFGVAAIPGHDFARARFLISFGADFLETWGVPTANARGFAAMRATTANQAGRFVAVEPRLSLTGANADEWISIPPGREMALALGMAHVIVYEGLGRGDNARDAVAAYTPDVVEQQTGVPAATVRRLARAFAQQRPSLAVAGGVATQHEQSVALLSAVNLLNWVAGNVGETVRFDRALNFDRVASFSDMQRLVATMGEGQIGGLVVHGANPVYAMPGWSGFAAALDKVPFKLSLSGVLDETSERCDLILPSTHSLESLGDDESVRGVHSLVQPAMRRVPTFDARPAGETLIGLARAAGFGTFPASWPEYLRQQWSAVHGRAGDGRDFDSFWSDALRDGGSWDSAAPPTPVSWAGVPPLAAPELKGQGDLALVLYPSPHLHDGRGANKAWLQELPDPTTKAVWGSWVEIHPETAGKLGVRTGDVVRVETEAGAVEVPAYLYAGIRRDTIALPLGQGHTAYGRYAQGRGVNALALLPPAQDAASGALAYLSARARVAKVAVGPSGPVGRPLGPQDLVLAQHEKNQNGRGIAQVIPVSALLVGAPKATPAAAPDTTLVPAPAPDTAHGTRGPDTTHGTPTADTARHAGSVADTSANDAAHQRAAHAAPGATAGVHGAAAHHPVHPSQTRPGRHTEPRTRAPGERTPAHAVTAYQAEHPARAARQIPVDQGSYGHAQHRWAMAIDLNSCTGCAACVTACYAENNIPAVGPDLVRRGRDMAWLRIERYEEALEGGRNDVRFVPMLCQHCTDAPCEIVCPVYATYHNPEGLNAQVYNRCVGTRYCSNNCPYKVRAFNFFDYTAPEKETFAFPEPLNWQLNPDVTVRSKGVMEKCTFCVQRILEGKGNARDQGRPLRDGEIQTACAQSCPTQAIVFGDLMDPESRVSQLSRHSERRYWVLNELNTKPAITYLKRIEREAETT